MSRRQMRVPTLPDPLMSSPAHDELSPARFRPSPMFVIAAFAIIAAIAGFLALQPLLAGGGPVRAASGSSAAGAKAVDAEALPRNNLLGSMYVIGDPKPVAPKFVALDPADAAAATVEEAPAAAAATADAAAAAPPQDGVAAPQQAPAPTAEPAAAVEPVIQPPF